jgi:hypothetical protein
MDVINRVDANKKPRHPAAARGSVPMFQERTKLRSPFFLPRCAGQQ